MKRNIRNTLFLCAFVSLSCSSEDQSTKKSTVVGPSGNAAGFSSPDPASSASALPETVPETTPPDSSSPTTPFPGGSSVNVTPTFPDEDWQKNQDKIDQEQPTTSFQIDFSRGTFPSNVDFFYADYKKGEDAKLQLKTDFRSVPGLGASGFFMSWVNRSDDLDTNLTMTFGPSHGLKPNTSYQVGLVAKAASNSPSDCLGIGGAPGESVVFNLLARAQPWKRVVNGMGFWRVPSMSAAPSKEIGNMANGINKCSGPVPFRKIVRSGTVTAQTSPTGKLNVLLNTHSGFEGKTEFFYLTVDVHLNEVR